MPDLMATLGDMQPPPGISFCTTDRPLRDVAGNVQLVTCMRRANWGGWRGHRNVDWNAKYVRSRRFVCFNCESSRAAGLMHSLSHVMAGCRP